MFSAAAVRRPWVIQTDRKKSRVNRSILRRGRAVFKGLAASDPNRNNLEPNHLLVSSQGRCPHSHKPRVQPSERSGSSRSTTQHLWASLERGKVWFSLCLFLCLYLSLASQSACRYAHVAAVTWRVGLVRVTATRRNDRFAPLYVCLTLCARGVEKCCFRAWTTVRQTLMEDNTLPLYISPVPPSLPSYPPTM